MIWFVVAVIVSLAAESTGLCVWFAFLFFISGNIISGLLLFAVAAGIDDTLTKRRVRAANASRQRRRR